MIRVLRVEPLRVVARVRTGCSVNVRVDRHRRAPHLRLRIVVNRPTRLVVSSSALSSRVSGTKARIGPRLDAVAVGPAVLPPLADRAVRPSVGIGSMVGSKTSATRSTSYAVTTFEDGQVAVSAWKSTGYRVSRFLLAPDGLRRLRVDTGSGSLFVGAMLGADGAFVAVAASNGTPSKIERLPEAKRYVFADPQTGSSGFSW